MQTITPFLWFDGKVEQAMRFCTSIFKDSKVENVSRMGGPDAPVMSATFELLGQRFHALNAGPQYAFTPAVSFFISVETQEEVDYYWTRLGADGSDEQCGWLKDQFGLSWQVIPEALGRLMGDPDQEKAGRVAQAMLGMKKIDVAGLERAYAGQ